MNIRTKIALSIVAGILAATLYSTPMWWGVLFSPISQPLTSASLQEDLDGGFRWETDGIVLRFKSLDLFFSFLRK